jgi:hypothetical protein
MPSNRRRLLVVVGLVLVLGAAGWTYFSSAGTATTSTSGGAAQRRGEPAGTPALPPAEAMSVDLATLGQPGEERPESRRNLFRFGAARPAPSQESPAQAFTPVTPALPEVAAKPVEATPAVQPIPLKFLGTLEKSSDGVKLAVLSLSDGRAPLYGKEGDIIDGRYRIVKIGAESIEMAHLDGRGQQAIRLSGQ